ncbi:MAG: hypothetical protein ABIH21_00890 [Patescibacteria group bacterium]
MDIQEILEGNFDAIPTGPRRLIDCSAQPHIPNGLEIRLKDQITSRVLGDLRFDPDKIDLYLDAGQKGDQTILGNDLRQILEGKPVLNACVLDHLLVNTQLIPEEWKQDSQGRTRYIYFWGTIYRASNGRLFVRCLYWNDGQWNWDYRWLGYRWRVQNPSAILAS